MPHNTLIYPNSVVLRPPESNQSSDEEAETSERPLDRSTPISKDMVVRSAHYDDRERNGHKNMYEFMITANRTIIDSKLAAE